MMLFLLLSAPGAGFVAQDDPQIRELVQKLATLSDSFTRDELVGRPEVKAILSKDRRAIPTLIRAMAPGGDGKIRIAAAFILGQIGVDEKAALALYQTWDKESDEDLRALISNVIQNSGLQARFRMIIKNSAPPKSAVVKELIRTWIQLDEESLAERIEAMTAHMGKVVRIFAIFSVNDSLHKPEVALLLLGHYGKQGDNLTVKADILQLLLMITPSYENRWPGGAEAKVFEEIVRVCKENLGANDREIAMLSYQLLSKLDMRGFKQAKPVLDEIIEKNPVISERWKNAPEFDWSDMPPGTEFEPYQKGAEKEDKPKEDFYPAGSNRCLRRQCLVGCSIAGAPALANLESCRSIQGPLDNQADGCGADHSVWRLSIAIKNDRVIARRHHQERNPCRLFAVVRDSIFADNHAAAAGDGQDRPLHSGDVSPYPLTGEQLESFGG